MCFEVFLVNGEGFLKEYYLVGGGFVVIEEDKIINKDFINIFYFCYKVEEIVINCKKLDLFVSELVWLNEQVWWLIGEIKDLVLFIWDEIKVCIYRGVNKIGQLLGGLGVKRCVVEINRKLLKE